MMTILWSLAPVGGGKFNIYETTFLQGGVFQLFHVSLGKVEAYHC